MSKLLISMCKLLVYMCKLLVYMGKLLVYMCKSLSYMCKWLVDMRTALIIPHSENSLSNFFRIEKKYDRSDCFLFIYLFINTLIQFLNFFYRYQAPNLKYLLYFRKYLLAKIVLSKTSEIEIHGYLKFNFKYLL